VIFAGLQSDTFFSLKNQLAQDRSQPCAWFYARIA
jgi:hypothetical protein